MLFNKQMCNKTGHVAYVTIDLMMSYVTCCFVCNIKLHNMLYTLTITPLNFIFSEHDHIAFGKTDLI